MARKVVLLFAAVAAALAASRTAVVRAAAAAFEEQLRHPRLQEALQPMLGKLIAFSEDTREALQPMLTKLGDLSEDTKEALQPMLTKLGDLSEAASPFLPMLSRASALLLSLLLVRRLLPSLLRLLRSRQNASAAPPSSPARAAPSPAKVVLVKVKEEPLGSPLRGVVSSSKLAAGTTPGVVLRKRRNSSPRPILAIHEDDLGLSAKSQRTLLSALNTGSYEELVALDGIGGTSAERIIKYRSGKGQGFCHVADLKKVLAAQLVSRIVNHYR